MTYFIQLCYKNNRVHSEFEQEDDTKAAGEARRVAQQVANGPTFEQDYVRVIDQDGSLVGRFVPGGS